jgi:endonuclease/exonuclease/phosphatase (EEP) superfamily protein YafD
MRARDGAGDKRGLPRAVGALLTVGGTLALLATVALTVPRLLEPRSYPVAVLAAAAPLGLLTSLLALVLLAPLGASTRRWSATVAAALALGLVVLHAGWLAPAFTGPAPAATNQGGVVVMVQNLEYGDVDDLVRVVEERDVDVLVLVDLGPEQHAAVEASALPARFAAGGPVTSAGGTLVLSRFPLGTARALTEDARSSVRAVDSSPVGPFVLAAVHPAAPYTDGTSAWRRQMASIGRGLAAEARSAGGAVVVLGDLNATPDQLPFRDLLRQADLRDAAEMANTGWAPTFPAHGLHTTRGLRLPPVVAIDHVLLGPALTVISIERVDVMGTDHLGLVAQLAPRSGRRPRDVGRLDQTVPARGNRHDTIPVTAVQACCRGR